MNKINILQNPNISWMSDRKNRIFFGGKEISIPTYYPILIGGYLSDMEDFLLCKYAIARITDSKLNVWKYDNNR
jgi:hypothetical protein